MNAELQSKLSSGTVAGYARSALDRIYRIRGGFELILMFFGGFRGFYIEYHG